MRTTRAGIWLRVSTGAQDEASQLPDLERYCAEHDYAVAERYVMRGRSAYHGRQQPALDRVLGDIRAGKISVLVIWHSDRLERREGKALLDVLAEIKAAGGRAESVQEPTLGAVDFGGQVTTFIAGLVNHEKSAHLAEQVRIKFDALTASGSVIGKAPFGYRVTGPKNAKRLVPTAQGREVVPQMFAACIAGDSMDTMAARHGLPCKTVAGILHNPTYCGRRRQGKAVVRCEAVIDAAVWERAQRSMATREHRGPRLPVPALLTACLRCHNCDRPMWSHGGRSAYRYYRCKGCGFMIRQSVADLGAMSLMSRSRQPWTEHVLTPGTDHSAELAEIRMEMRDLDVDLPAEQYDERMAELRAERDRLASLPAVPDRWETRATGQTVGEHWRGLDRDGQRAMLKRDTRIWAGRDGNGEKALLVSSRYEGR